MTQGLVKVCGLCEPEHAVAAAEAGADLLGFIFAPTRRQVTPETAAACLAAARAVAPGVRGVGVFVDADPATIRDIRERATLDLVQLHGSVSADLLDRVGGAAFVVVRSGPEATVESVAALVQPLAGRANFGGMLLDAYHPTEHGGTGLRADWALARAVASTTPLILAGGLTPESVAEAIAAVRPHGVDVSSGVEIDGRKDADRIRAFVTAARAGFANR